MKSASALRDGGMKGLADLVREVPYFSNYRYEPNVDKGKGVQNLKYFEDFIYVLPPRIPCRRRR